MARRTDGLFPDIASFAALEAAAQRAARGKRRKPGVAAFLARMGQGRATEIGEWIIECESGEELFERLEGVHSPSPDGQEPVRRSIS